MKVEVELVLFSLFLPKLLPPLNTSQKVTLFIVLKYENRIKFI